MARTVLHQCNTPSRGYEVAGATLCIQSCPSGWQIRPSGHGPSWRERNGELFSQVFPRLRDAREALEALLEVDPLPSDMRRGHAAKGTSFKRVRAGEYQVTHCEEGKKHKAKLVRERYRRGEDLWHLRVETGECLALFRNLNAARQKSRDWLMGEAAGMSYREWLLAPGRRGK